MIHKNPQQNLKKYPLRSLVQAVTAGLILNCSPGFAASIDEAIQAYDDGDHEKSHQLFYTLSRLGNPVAAKQLAYMAAEGEGRDQNPAHTYAYLKMAQTWGDTSVTPFLKQLENELNASELDQAEHYYDQIEARLYIKDTVAVPLETAYRLNEKTSIQAVKRVEPTYPERSARQGANGWSQHLMFVNQAGDVVTTETYGSRFGNFSRAAERALNGWKYDTDKPAVSRMRFSFFVDESDAVIEAMVKAIRDDLWEPALSGAPAHQRMLAEIFGQIEYHQKLQMVTVESTVSGAPSLADLASGASSSGQVERPKIWTSGFWWQQAAQNGDLEAQRRLALNDGQWMNYLLEQHDIFAQTWLGAMLVTRGQDAAAKEQGIGLLRQAADKGSDRANTVLNSI